MLKNKIREQLVIRDLEVSVANKTIIKGVNLTIRKGEIHAVMGPNGSGKSTLAYALMGHPNYQINSQKSRIEIDGENIVNFTSDERAKRGLFLAFQNPLTLPGVSIMNFLRLAFESVKRQKIAPLAFYKLLKKKAAILEIGEDFLKRSVNDGFSGGEKKKLEMLQLLVLEPNFAIVDEIDTGLDVDALKLVASALDKVSKSSFKPAFLIITHYQRIFNYLKPDFVHIMKQGKIVVSGKADLILKIEREGYAKITG